MPLTPRRESYFCPHCGQDHEARTRGIFLTEAVNEAVNEAVERAYLTLMTTTRKG
ncbi:hypothetical protein EV700_3108 [Fluviicoccus keumensis]|uniref:Uncharacterized protein n=1 Tax=Fluviicoccus keumensis TaxID=1435465 RepID=A0A4Q7YK77_9GAMM|nr:hypothetical protein [Fluviicoccus keumensis]RZU36895.1 hypothetical protein EV700_3108 [Fluviicoccus keumensis]